MELLQYLSDSKEVLKVSTSSLDLFFSVFHVCCPSLFLPAGGGTKGWWKASSRQKQPVSVYSTLVLKHVLRLGRSKLFEAWNDSESEIHGNAQCKGWADLQKAVILGAGPGESSDTLFKVVIRTVHDVADLNVAAGSLEVNEESTSAYLVLEGSMYSLFSLHNTKFRNLIDIHKSYFWRID